MQVDLEPQNKRKIKRKLNSWTDRAIDAIVPIAVVLSIGLYTYALAYRVIWKRVELQNKPASIALLTVFGFLISLTFYEWILIHIYGPGKITKEYLKASDDDPFLCDRDGFALWCTECNHVKPTRAHHSSKLNRCVPVMDHYCIWIGAVIGQGNRKFFILFSLITSIALTYCLVLLLIFQHEPYPRTMPLSIVLYILTGFYLMFCYIVTFQHFKLLARSETTLNSLRFRKSDVYVNFPCTDSTRRLVVNATQKGTTMSDLFSEGAWKNIKNVMGPLWSWFLPMRPPIYEPLMNPKLIEQFQLEGEQGACENDRVEKSCKASIPQNRCSSRSSASLAPVFEDE